MPEWMLPPPDLLPRSIIARDEQRDHDDLLRALAELGAPCQIESVRAAPQVLRYELRPAEGVLARHFAGLEPELMLKLGAGSVRIDRPTPGARTVGVELPRLERAIVRLGDLADAAQGPLSAAVGVGVEGHPLVINLANLPHLLVAGRSGGGKSVALHAILCSLLAQHTPQTLELLLSDCKMTEFSRYEGLPHASHIVYDAETAIDVMWGLVETMKTTYQCMKESGARTLDELNTMLTSEGELPIPRRLLVVDELAELMMTGRGRVESAVVRIGQLGRAAGVHLCLATQSPRHTCLTGMIKANMVGRMAMATTTALDSRIILDQNGAESLLGRGDLLYDDGQSGRLRRGQAAWASSDDVDTVVQWWREQARMEVAA